VKDAFADFEAAEQADVKSPTAPLHRADLFLRAGRFDEGADAFRRIIRDHPHLAAAHFGLARALAADSQKSAEALAEFNRACELAPDRADGHEALAGYLVRLNRPREAVDAYRQSLRVAPDRPKNHAALGDLLASLADHAAAIRHYRLALAFHPESTETMEKLAWLLATSSDASVRNGEEAIRLAEQACKRTKPPSPAALDALAAGYAESGRFDDALATMQQALTRAAPEEHAKWKQRLDLYNNRQPMRESVGPVAPSKPVR
jgi:tetratricopeptide (TPR) repeat protein